MRYELNFEAETFAGYPELDLLRTNSGFNREGFFPSSNGELEEEFGFQGTSKVQLTCSDAPVPLLDVKNHPATTPKGAAIYVIWVYDKVWYVGKAQGGKSTIRSRFKDRLAVLDNFRIDLREVTVKRNIKVSWLKLDQYPGKEFKIRTGSRPATSATEEKLLEVLEMYYIWNLQTHKTFGKGNKDAKSVIIDALGSEIVIEEIKGKRKQTLKISSATPGITSRPDGTFALDPTTRYPGRTSLVAEA